MNPIRQFYDAVWNSAAAVQSIVERQSAGREGEIDGVPFHDARTDRKSELAALNAAFVGDLPALFAAALRSESDQTARQAIEAVRAAYVEFRDAAGRLDPRPSNTRWQAASDAMFAALGTLYPFATAGAATGAQPATVDDDSAFVDAATLRKERSEFTRAEQLTRWLLLVNRDKKIIRTKKPSRNRLLIHSGDWHRYWQAQEKRPDALDGSAEEVDRLLSGMAARQRTERHRPKS